MMRWRSLVALGVSGLGHVALVSAALSLGSDLSASRVPSVVFAQIVPAEPLPAMESRAPVAPRPSPPSALRSVLERVLPRLATPAPRAVAPAAEPVTVSPPEAAVAPSPAAPPPPSPVPSPAAAPVASGSLAASGDFVVQEATVPAAAHGRAGAPAPTSPAGSSPQSPTSGRSSSATMVVPGDAVTGMAIPKGGYQVRPSYPSNARRLGIQGTTTLRVYVAVDGAVTDVVVHESAGHPDLDHAAADAVKRWRFEPARRGTEAVGIWVLLPVEFRLR